VRSYCEAANFKHSDSKTLRWPEAFGSAQRFTTTPVLPSLQTPLLLPGVLRPRSGSQKAATPVWLTLATRHRPSLALRTDHLEKSLEAAINAGCEVTVPIRPLDLLNNVTNKPWPVRVAFFRGLTAN
jgi:hypothetical protein